MPKLAEVEEAKRLMSEAKEWSVWKWLTEKRRVRTAADAATAALEKAEKRIKADWPEDLKKLYRRASIDGGDPRHHAVFQVKQADDAAYQARMDAEATFDEAERRLSASMAREGAQKAIDAYCLHEQAIKRARKLVSDTN